MFVHTKPKSVTTNGESKAQIEPTGSVVVTGERPAKDVYTVVLETREPSISGLQLTALAFENGKGPGRTDHGNFVLS